MPKRILFTALLLAGCFTQSHAQTTAPKPFGPIPNANQINWQEMEYYAFLHFSINTYTDQEWGSGEDSASIFNPTKLDCRQWARVCKQSGMKGIIITAKHHSGFCLWPSKYTAYSVKNSPWKNGKGDIIKELSAACKEYGLKLGIYLSPWDRNYAGYGKPEYITYFRNQLTELLTNYGDIFEIWFDGANGGSGYYGGAKEIRKIDRKTYYDWDNTYKLARKLQPKIVIWNDGGERGDLRWVGTEAGYVGETNWSLLNVTGDVPEDMLRHGLEDGNAWVPGEVNTSIRPGWFYHKYEDSRVKDLPKLLETYYSSIGRNGTLLLNFPIDRKGLIHEIDEKSALSLAKTVKETFATNLAEKKNAKASDVRGDADEFGADKAIDGNKETYWSTNDSIKTASLEINFGKPTIFNRFLAQEYIKLGQRVKTFTVEAKVNNNWRKITEGTTIGYKRILVFPTVIATQIRFTVTDAKACPLIANVGIYNAPQILTPPAITRNQSGNVEINASDKESEIFYTLDGGEATKHSIKYKSPFLTVGKVEIRAIAFDKASGKNSIETQEKFDISHKNWKIVGSDDEKANRIIDGNPGTDWFQPKGKSPQEIVIDLGKPENLSGFRYLPSQTRNSGFITSYKIMVSKDNRHWKLVGQGEFANIKNNPLWQTKSFKPVKARYLKSIAINNFAENETAGYAEIDVITL